jgi:hypothetical protein
MIKNIMSQVKAAAKAAQQQPKQAANPTPKPFDINERLSANFTMREYLASPKATSLKFHEQFNPPMNIVENIRWINTFMQKARDLFGKALVIGSGYRCKRLNDSIPGAATRSEHLDALGVDISTRNFTEAEVIRLIEIFIEMGVKRIGLAKTFIHVGFSSDRPQFVVFDYQGAKATPAYLQRERARLLQLMRSTKAKL